MKGYRIFRPSTNTIYDRYHVIFDDSIIYGDFMGTAFKQRIQADALQREYHNAEVASLLGSDPQSYPLADILCQHPWAPLPDPDVAAPGSHQLEYPATRLDRNRLHPEVDDNQGPSQRPCLTRSRAGAARTAIAKELLRGVVPRGALTPMPMSARVERALGCSATRRHTPTADEEAPPSPPLTAPGLPLVTGEAPSQRMIRALQLPDVRDAFFHASDVFHSLHSIHDILFDDPVFIEDIECLGFYSHGITLLHLNASTSRMMLTDHTSRRIASTAAPTMQRQIDALDGTTEGALIREAQMDEVMSMIEEGRVLPVDMRTLSGYTNQIDGKWVVKYKKQLNGLLERVRARWTLRGDRQLPHRDYDPDKIYSPVASKTTHYTLFILAVQFGLHLWSLDISKAFMLGPIDRPNMFMRVPTGFRNCVHPDYCPFGEHTTYELLCSLYGLKQAAAVYYETMKALLLAFKFDDGSTFRISKADPCMFVRGSLTNPASPYVAITTHIDDKFIACRRKEDRAAIERIFTAAQWNFKMQTMDCVLGITIDYKRWDPNSGDIAELRLSHTQYIEDAYRKFKSLLPQDCVGNRNVPIKAETVSMINAQPPQTWATYCRQRHKHYRSVLGTLSHVANFTHPEIAFAISFASQFMANPSQDHLRMVLDILLYLHTAKDKNIVFKRQTSPPAGSPIWVACDADLGNSKLKRSRSGYSAYLYGNLVAWHSRLQPSVSLSTAEAEYMALAAAGRFAIWFKMLVGDFGIECSYHQPANILSDNKSAMCIAKNPITQKHSKHIDRRLHWLREQVLALNLTVHFVPTADNPADIHTKALKAPLFRTHRDKHHSGYSFTIEHADQHFNLAFLIDCIDRDSEFLMLAEL